MNLDFSDDQKFLKEQANKFLTEKCETTVARNVLEGDDPMDRDLWRSIVEMGWTSTAIPETYGGLGLGYLELCVIAEELGRAIAPVPFSSSVYLATEALILAGSEEQKQHYLPRLASGEMIGTFAISEGVGQPTPKTMSIKAQSGVISGAKIPVADGMVADFAVVAAKSSDDKSDGSVSLYLVDLNQDGVTRQPVETLDPSRKQAKLVFNNAKADNLGAQGEGWELTKRIFDRAAVLFAFEQIGGADKCLEMATEYAKERFAFGRPIGSNQAIKHKLADIYVKNVLARSNSYYGAWALSTDAPDLPIASASARVSAIDAYDFASKENIQTHGGMGFTWEVDCHLYYRRAKNLALAIGGAPVWKERLVGQLEKRNVA